MPDALTHHQRDLDFVTNGAPQQRLRITQQRLDRNWTRPECSLMRKRQELVGQAHAAIDGALDRFDLDLEPTIFCTSFDHLQIAGDDGQEIVEVMGDAGGELANRFHLLRLAQQVLCMLPFRQSRHQLRIGFGELHRALLGHRQIGDDGGDHLLVFIGKVDRRQIDRNT